MLPGLPANRCLTGLCFSPFLCGGEYKLYGRCKESPEITRIQHCYHHHNLTYHWTRIESKTQEDLNSYFLFFHETLSVIVSFYYVSKRNKLFFLIIVIPKAGRLMRTFNLMTR